VRIQLLVDSGCYPSIFDVMRDRYGIIGMRRATTTPASVYAPSARIYLAIGPTDRDGYSRSVSRYSVGHLDPTGSPNTSTDAGCGPEPAPGIPRNRSGDVHAPEEIILRVADGQPGRR